MTALRSRKGITLIELMVTIAIMGFLVTVALPNIFGVAEKTREKVDLLKLYYLRDALNRALIEDLDALTKFTPVTNGSKKDYQNLNKIGSNQGAALFVIELHSDLPMNVQGYHKDANKTTNICGAIGSGGTFYNALKEAHFEGVADIVRDRLAGNKSNKNNVDTYIATDYVNQNNETDYRTYPIQPMFISRALTHGDSTSNTRYTMSVQWSPGNEGFSVEVFLLPNGKQWNQAFKTKHGVCFSTYGKKGCAKSGK